MKENKIKILLLQETHINKNCMEQRKHYTFYSAGNMNRKDAKGEISNNPNAGVGIVIDNELLNYITEIEPIHDRIMTITLGHTMPITFFNCYGRTAARPSE